MTKLQLKLIDAYVILILAERKDILDAPIELKEAIEIKIAEKTIEILE